ncbi:MAG: chemotaxis protein CheB, partial [Nitrospinota bacterium]
MEEKLKADRGLIVAGKSSSGPDAILKAREIRPDVIVVDLEMPFMSGLETIEHLMASYPTPMLATTRRSIEDIKEPLEKGALEVIKKSEIEKCTPADFSQKIRFLTSVTVFARVSRYSSKESTPLPKTSMECPCHSQKIITIASSTGGPRAISEILRKLPEDTPFPIVIAQHMPEGFTEGMVRWMNTLSKLSIKVGETGDRLKEGMVYFSPAEKHMIIDEAKCITLELQKNSDIYHPSCNKLLNSAARMYGKNTIAVILTGMGDDGVEGMKTV